MHVGDWSQVMGPGVGLVLWFVKNVYLFGFPFVSWVALFFALSLGAGLLRVLYARVGMGHGEEE